MTEPAPPATPPRSPGVRRAVAVTIGVVLAVVCLEVAMRQVYWRRYFQDPHFGSVPWPGDTVVYWLEGHGRSRWTHHGIRRASLPEPDSRPLLAVGDSFTEAYNVDDASVFTEQLENALAADGTPIPVLNAGRSGASPADYVARADTYRELFAPRWTILQLRSGDLEREGFDPGETHFVRKPDGALGVEVVKPRLGRFNHVFAPFRSASALVNYGLVRVKEFAAAAQNEPPLFRAASMPAPDAQAERPPQPVADVLASLARAYDGRVTLLFLPDFDLRAPDAVTSASEQVFAAQCAAHGWSCVNLRDAFPDFARAFESPYGHPNSTWNVGHMNELGHAATARLLRDEIARLHARDLL